MAGTVALRPRVAAEGGLFRRLLSGRNLIILAVVAIVGYLGAVPVGFLLWQTFVRGGALTFANFRGAYTDVGLGEMMVNSLTFAIGSCLVSLTIGSVLAYLIVRTDVPGKPLMFAASLVPLIIPGILHTIAWVFILDPNIGIANKWFIQPLDGGHAFNVFSLPGMIVIEGLHLAPLVFLLMAAALRSMDPSLEESAIMSGASLPTVFRKITLPLVKPALYAGALIMIVRGLESFEVPAVVGLRNHIWVYTSRIWQTLNDAIPNYGKAGAYAMTLLALTAIGVWFQSRLQKRGRSFQTITGKGFRPHPVHLGVWRIPATMLILLYFLVAVVLPVLVLVYASTQQFYSPPSHYTLTHMTLHNYVEEWHEPVLRHAVLNMAQSVRVQALGIARIVTGHVSSRAIGGPLMIADVARKAAEAGWREMLATMSLISMALGLMNLIPVPALDGFHVLTSLVEGVRRKPLSLRFREVANVVGIALLLTLMLYAFRNDAMRMWFE